MGTGTSTGTSAFTDTETGTGMGPPDGAEALLTRARQTADPGRRRTDEERVIRDHLWLARTLAARYHVRGEHGEDLYQVACLGLMKAVNGFRPELGNRFLAYAEPTITGELKRYVRDHCWGVRPPRRLQELRLAVREGELRAQQQLGRVPSSEEVGSLLGLSGDTVDAARQADAAYTSVSLDAPRSWSAPDSTWGDDLAEESSLEDTFADRDALRRALGQLPARSRRILAMRFSGGMTQQEIAEEVGVTQMQVSRLLRQALGRLRVAMDGAPEDAAHAG